MNLMILYRALRQSNLGTVLAIPIVSFSFISISLILAVINLKITPYFFDPVIANCTKCPQIFIEVAITYVVYEWIAIVALGYLIYKLRDREQAMAETDIILKRNNLNTHTSQQLITLFEHTPIGKKILMVINFREMTYRYLIAVWLCYHCLIFLFSYATIKESPEERLNQIAYRQSCSMIAAPFFAIIMMVGLDFAWFVICDVMRQSRIWWHEFVVIYQTELAKTSTKKAN